MLKIAITGPESTGKTWLAKRLADYFDVPWVEEYARTYLAELEAPYTFEDILNIAKGQLAAEKQLAERSPKLLICDTDILVCKIWQEYKYQKVSPWIEEAFQKNSYDLFLVCDVDLPWSPDPLREHPDPKERNTIFQKYLNHLQKGNKKYVIVQAYGQERLENAIKAIKKIMIP